MPSRVVVPPEVEPVTNAQATLWCRAAAADAPLIDMLIQAARERAEHLTQRVFVQRKMEWIGSGFFEDLPIGSGLYPPDHWRAKLSETPPGRADGITLVAPVQSIESVKYIDRAGTLQTLDSTGYVLDAVAEPAVLRYQAGLARPVTSYRADAVRVRFVAGYPADVTNPDQPDYRKNLPAALLAWMQVQISTWYTQRESVETSGRLVETSRNFVEALLDGLIVSTRFV